jgi:hypothetical protein
MVCVCVFYYVGGSGEITFLFHVGLLTMRFKIGTSSYIYIYIEPSVCQCLTYMRCKCDLDMVDACS